MKVEDVHRYGYNKAIKNIITDYNHRYIILFEGKELLLPKNLVIPHVARIEYFILEKKILQQGKSILVVGEVRQIL